MESGGRQPAPGALAQVQDFINTLDIESGYEELSSPDRLQQWLLARGLLEAGARVDESDRIRAVALRESLRALLELNHAEKADSDTAAAFNDLTARISLRVQLQPDGRVTLEPAVGGVDGTLGRLLSIVYAAGVDGTWRRLKVCPADTCRWAFYDHSKNRSGTWCAMAVCGNRSKVRAYQRRRRAIAG